MNSKVVGIVGKANGFTANNSHACVVIPEIDEKLLTPHTESFQAVIWHLIVSHPLLTTNKTKWESISEKNLYNT